MPAHYTVDFNGNAMKVFDTYKEQLDQAIGQLGLAVQEVVGMPTTSYEMATAYVNQLTEAAKRGGIYLLTPKGQEDAASGKPVLGSGSPSSNGSAEPVNETVMNQLRDMAAALRASSPEEAANLVAGWFSELPHISPPDVTRRCKAAEQVLKGGNGYGLAPGDTTLQSTADLHRITNRFPNIDDIVAGASPGSGVSGQLADLRKTAIEKLARGEFDSQLNPDATVKTNTGGVDPAEYNKVVNENTALKNALAALNSATSKALGSGRKFNPIDVPEAHRNVLAAGGYEKVKP